MRRVAAFAVFFTGCALTRNAPPAVIRHFTPDVTSEEDSPKRAACGAVALGRIDASAHLRYRIARRTSPVELSLYDTFRWTDHPDVYVRRSLAHALFHDARFVEVMRSSDAPVLEVEVIAFEQVDQPVVGGHVELSYRLRSGDAILASGVVTSRQPSGTGHIASIVTAIGEATEQASRELATRIAPRIRSRAGCRRARTRKDR